MRPNNFWDVLSETANYAGDAIPAAQEQNRRTAQERERFGLRAQQEQEQFGETKRYHNEMIGLQRDRMNAQQHPTAHPSFDQVYADILQHPEKYDPQVVKDFKDAAADRHPGPKEPKPKDPPNFIGDIGADYDRRMNTYNVQMGRAKETGITPQAPTMVGSFNRFAGQFPKYGVSRDSIAAGVGIQPYELNTVDSLPPMNPGGIRSKIGPNPPARGVNPPANGQNPLPNDLSTLSDEELDALERQITGQ